MAVKLSPLFQDAQFDSSGNPWTGAQLFTYTAGSSTKQTTYQDSGSVTPHTNPIILNSRGEPPAEIWLTSGVSYKFVLTSPTDSDPPVSPTRTMDNVSGVNDTTVTQDQWVSGPAPTFVSTTSFTLVGDQTSTFHVGRRVKTTNSGGTIYSIISASAFGAVTTVTVVNDSGVLDSGLSAVSYGLLSSVNPSTPLLTDTNPIVSGSADKTKKFRVEVDGFTTATTRVFTPPNQDLTVVANGSGTRTITLPDQDLVLVNLAGICEGRLSLTTAVPVTTADVTAATTVYFTPYKGSRIATYDGAKWNVAVFTEKSVAVPSNTNTPFDLFIVDATLALEATAWTNDTTRATALVVQDGVYVKSGSTTKRYLGTGRTTGSSGQTEDSVTNRFLWNYYNRVLRGTLTTYSADRSTASGTYVELNTEIRSSFVLGVSEDAVMAGLNGSGINDSAAAPFSVAISYDSTTVATPGLEGVVYPAAAATDSAMSIAPSKKMALAVGGHFATVLARTSGANTGRLRSSSAAGTAKTYLSVGVWA